ncbi:hypothetical protein [Flavobacterium gilvum]|uniref:Fibronectin type-III domain-containing protein n=1 Tax=Flavobacterium gilvum TaxID=1492737 RepID=A0AAC9I3N0_9FLAO|nr:hypothetical protein [Flavobacterium gilvum]AOW08932.1 hypothetical protein EM308_05085 [Flavobacterium gilvum]KFC60917.1 hypothetical protein FEM08_03070 [Flavobacterium gilvum]
MKQFFLACLFFIVSPVLIFSQSIFNNPITGTYPGQSNPYTIGQNVDPGIKVSGIGRSGALSYVNANNRYDAKGWKVDDSDSDTYFEFTITPNQGRQINFISFVYTGQVSANGPRLFAFRSSVDGFSTNIGSVSGARGTVSLSSTAFQGVDFPITFRFYGWAAITRTGAFSINDFQFNGVVSCVKSQAPTLPEVNLACTSTSFILNWAACSNASNYFIDVATDSGFINNLEGYKNKILGNTLSETVEDLAAGGPYYVRLKSANECGEISYSNVIKAAPPETIYNGSWSNGLPDSGKNVRFSKDFNLNESLETCSCQIDNGVAVHVDSGGVLKLQNRLDVLGAGTITFENNSSLIQVNDAAVNIGQIIYNRITSPMKNFDFTYWSSPVQGQILNVLSPNTLSDKYFSFANGNWVYENGANSMDPAGKGFVIRVPKPDTKYSNKEYWTGSTYSQPVQFKGIPNNGVIEILSEGIGMDNLIGNPYPSAIDADEFIKANSAIIVGTLNFWTHNTAIKQDGAFYVYNSDDYASYNLTGGTGTAAPSAGDSGTIPNGKIASGVSFFVTSKVAGNFVFNNAMRNSGKVLASNSNNQFFKISNTKKDSSIEKNRLWLNLTNSEGAFKQLLVGYVTGATNEMDNLYDGTTSDGNAFVDFYSISEENKLVIQGRALPFDYTDKVALGFKTNIDGAFEIKIDHTDGLLSNCAIFLEDKNTGILHDLKERSYPFSASKGEYNSRFVLSYKELDIKSTSKQETEKTKQGLAIYTQEKQLSINSAVEKISMIVIYDLNGKLLYKKKDIDKEQIVIPNLTSKHQILIVKTVFDNSDYQINKVFF